MPPASVEPATENASGKVAVRLLAAPGSPEVTKAEDEEYVQPYLFPENPIPTYPPARINDALPPYSVILRVTFDESGDPVEIVRSPLATGCEKPAYEEFEKAAMAALGQWRCRPPRLRKFRDGPDGDGDGAPDYKVLADEKIFASFFDVSFTFELVDGVPYVRQK